MPASPTLVVRELIFEANTRNDPGANMKFRNSEMGNLHPFLVEANKWSGSGGGIPRFKTKAKSVYEPNGPSDRRLQCNSSFWSRWSDWEYCYSPLDGMRVHHRVTPLPSIMIVGTHLYTWVKRDNVE